GLNSPFTIAARLFKIQTQSYTLAARLASRVTKAYTLAARLLKVRVKTYTLSARLIRTGTKTYTLSARLGIVIVPPTVTIQDATNVQPTEATLHATITATGGKNCAIRGFEWGTAQGGPYPYSWVETGDFGVGPFEHTITDLIPGTTYYFRGKASH
ncbi:unnamed protein product, partial [marine sediment metagenome]